MNKCIALQIIPHSAAIKQLLELPQQGDWFAIIDLKDAYFHAEVALKHRRFLNSVFHKVAYEYNRLLFGYSLAISKYVM